MNSSTEIPFATEISSSTKILLDEIDKLFAKQNAKWDQWFADRDARWSQRFSVRSGNVPAKVSGELPSPAPATTTAASSTSPAAVTNSPPPPTPATAPVLPASSPVALAPSASSSAVTESASSTVADAAAGVGDGGREISLASQTASTSPAFDSTYSGLDATDYNTASMPLSSVSTTNNSPTRLFPAPEVLVEQVPVEQFAKGVDLHEFIDGGSAASHPRRAPPRPSHPRRPRRTPRRAPHPGRPRRAPLRVPRPRRPRRARLRVLQLRRPRRALSPSTVSSSAADASTTASRETIFISSGSKDSVTLSSTTPCAISIELANPDISKRSVDGSTRARGYRLLADQVPVEQFFKGLGLHNLPWDDLDLTPPRRVNLVVPKHAKLLPVAAMAISSKTLSSSVGVRLLSDEMQQRYSTNSTPAYSAGIVLLCQAIKICDAQKVLEELLAQSTIMLGPLPVQVFEFDKGLGPLSLQFGKQSTDDKFQLRPIPWPPFSFDTVGVQYKLLLQMGCYYSDSGSMTKQFHHELSSDCLEHCLESPVQSHWVQIFWVYTVKPSLEYISGDSLQYCLTSYGAALPVHRIICQDIILLEFLDDPIAILQKLIEHFSAFSDGARLATLQSCFVKYCWVQWEIPWPSFEFLTAVQLEKGLSHSWLVMLSHSVVVFPSYHAATVAAFGLGIEASLMDYIWILWKISWSLYTLLCWFGNGTQLATYSTGHMKLHSAIRLYSEAVIHDGAKIQVASDGFPYLDNQVHDVQIVFAKLSAHYSVMLVPLHAQALDTGQLGFTFGSLFNFGSDTTQPRQPWPPPILIEFTGSSQFRPLPWPLATLVWGRGDRLLVSKYLQKLLQCYTSGTDGYLFELIQRNGTPEPLCQVTLHVGSGCSISDILIYFFSFSFQWTKTLNVTITRSLQDPSTLFWLSSNGMIPRLVHMIATAVLNQVEMLQCLVLVVHQQQLSDVYLICSIMNQHHNMLFTEFLFRSNICHLVALFVEFLACTLPMMHMVFVNSTEYQPWDPGIMVTTFTCILLSIQGGDNFLKSSGVFLLVLCLEMLHILELWRYNVSRLMFLWLHWNVWIAARVAGQIKPEICMQSSVKTERELIMIINYWRLSLCSIQFYHQVVDDP